MFNLIQTVRDSETGITRDQSISINDDIVENSVKEELFEEFVKF